MKTQFYFSEKSIPFILCAVTFFCTSPINFQQPFNKINGLNAFIYQPLHSAACPAKHNTELLFLRLSDKAEMLPVGNAVEDYFTVSLFLPGRLVEGHLPSISKNIFLPNKYYNAFTQ